MEFSRELLFFFSALGAFNGLLMGFYFILFARPRHSSNYFLGILLVTLSIRIGKSVFYYFNPDLSEIFLQIGISSVAFVGPSIYLYFKSLTKDGFETHTSIYHYLPILILVLAIGILYPWESNPHVWYYMLNAIYWEWLIYILLSGFAIKDLFIILINKKQKLSQIQIWILSILFGNLVIWIAYKVGNYTSYIVGALSFSFVFYLLFLMIFFIRKKNTTFLGRPIKYGDKKIDNEEAIEMENLLTSTLNGKKLYKNPELKLPDLAKEINILPHRLSQFINDNLQKNFALYINEYRIEEAKSLIKSESHMKLESIGYECGFNSKSTFYSAFKKVTGTTPAKYQESIIQ